MSKASKGNDRIGSIGITGNPSQYLVDRSVSSTQILDASGNFQNVSNVSSSKNKMLEPETFDGISSAEWAEYIIHFEQIAEWNNWSNTQKTESFPLSCAVKPKNCWEVYLQISTTIMKPLRLLYHIGLIHRNEKVQIVASSLIAGARKTKVLVTLASLYCV